MVASFINRIGTAVPAFDVHDAFVEYAGSLLTGNEPGCSMRFLKSMLLRWRKNALYDFGIGRVQDGLAYRLSGSKCCCRGRQVPLTLAREIPDCLPAIVGGRRLEDISLWALYPGGRSILDALSEALGLNEDALRHLREVLRCFGNMSSATIMFVLKSMLRTKSASGLGCAMAFGPGLAAESMIFEVAGRSRRSDRCRRSQSS